MDPGSWHVYCIVLVFTMVTAPTIEGLPSATGDLVMTPRAREGGKSEPSLGGDPVFPGGDAARSPTPLPRPPIGLMCYHWVVAWSPSPPAPGR